MKWFYIIALLVVAALTASPFLLLSQEHQRPVEQVVVDYPDPDRPVVNTDPVIRYDSYSAAIRSIDATTAGDTTSASFQGNFYDGLYSYHYLLRDRGRPIIIPELAAEMPRLSDDRKTVTIPLKKTVLFHRNPCFGKVNESLFATRAVTADDFVLAFKRVADYHNAKVSLAWAFLSNRIEGLDEFRQKTRSYKAGDFSRYDLDVPGIKAIDEHTLQLTLTEPYPQLTMVLALSNYAPCPREAIDYWLTGQGKTPPDERSVEFTEAEMVVGTGAYILHTFRRKDQVVLVRNPDYREEYYPTAEEMIELAERRGFGEAGRDWVAQLESMGLLQDAAKRVPFIDAMVFEFVGETYPAWMLFLSRRTDASGIPRETFEGIVTPEKKLTDQWRRRGIYMRTSWVPSVYWIAFNMEDPLLGASQSLRQAMCLSYDVAMQIKVLYNDRGRPARNIVPTAFKAHRAAGPGPWYRFDVEAAKQKIAQARSELAAAGLLDEDGEIPEIKFDLGQGTNSKRMAEFARQQFSRIGLRIKPVHNDWPTLQQKVHNKQAQMYTMGWHADYYDSETFLQLFYSPNIAKGTNNTNYSNPAYDRLYEQIRSMPDTPRRTELYAEMINIISEDVPVLLLSEPQAFVLYYDWFQNVLRHPIGYGFSKYQRIDAEMRRKMGGRP